MLLYCKNQAKYEYNDIQKNDIRMYLLYLYCKNLPEYEQKSEETICLSNSQAQEAAFNEKEDEQQRINNKIYKHILSYQIKHHIFDFSKDQIIKNVKLKYISLLIERDNQSITNHNNHIFKISDNIVNTENFKKFMEIYASSETYYRCFKKRDKDFYIFCNNLKLIYPNLKLKHNSYYTCNLHLIRKGDSLTLGKLNLINLTEISIDDNDITLKSKRPQKEIYFPYDIQNLIYSFLGNKYSFTQKITLKDIRVKLKGNSYCNQTSFYIEDDICKYKKFIDFIDYNNMMVDKIYDKDYERDSNYSFIKRKDGSLYYIICNKVNEKIGNCRDFIIDLTFYQEHNFRHDYQDVNDNKTHVPREITFTQPIVTIKKAILSKFKDGEDSEDDEEQTNSPEICYNDLIDINEVLNYSKIVIQDVIIIPCRGGLKYEINDKITRTEKFINFYEKVHNHFKDFLKGKSEYSYEISTKRITNNRVKNCNKYFSDIIFTLKNDGLYTPKIILKQAITKITIKNGVRTLHCQDI